MAYHTGDIIHIHAISYRRYHSYSCHIIQEISFQIHDILHEIYIFTFMSYHTGCIISYSWHLTGDIIHIHAISYRMYRFIFMTSYRKYHSHSCHTIQDVSFHIHDILQEISFTFMPYHSHKGCIIHIHAISYRRYHFLFMTWYMQEI